MKVNPTIFNILGNSHDFSKLHLLTHEEKGGQTQGQWRTH